MAHVGEEVRLGPVGGFCGFFGAFEQQFGVFLLGDVVQGN
jgi:hypothetical protein